MKHVIHHPLLDDHPKPGGGFPLLILRRHGFGLARQSMLVQQYQGRKQDREYMLGRAEIESGGESVKVQPSVELWRGLSFCRNGKSIFTYVHVRYVRLAVPPPWCHRTARFRHRTIIFRSPAFSACDGGAPVDQCPSGFSVAVSPRECRSGRESFGGGKSPAQARLRKGAARGCCCALL